MKEAAAQFDKTYHSHRYDYPLYALPCGGTGAVISGL